MFCHHLNANGTRIADPSYERIQEFVARYVAGEISSISLESVEMGGIGIELLSHAMLGFCAYGVEESERGTFGYQTFNGSPSDVLKDISIYQFPESVFLKDGQPIGEAALEFVRHGTISRKLAWQFRFELAIGNIPDPILTSDDPRSVQEFLDEHASLM